MEKAGLIGLVKIRYIESDDKLSLRGDKLKEAIAYDRENGLIPFYVRVDYKSFNHYYEIPNYDLVVRHSGNYWSLLVRQPGGAGSHM